MPAIGEPSPTRTRSSLTIALLLCSTLELALGSPLEAQPVGYSHSGANIYEISLSASGELPWSAIPTAAGGTTEALAFSPEGVLFAAHTLGEQRLEQINPSTGVFDFVGPLAPDADDLAFGADGRLWMVSDGSLYQVDPSNASTVEVPLVDPHLLAIASHQGTLFGIRSTLDPNAWTFDFVSIDPDLATTLVVSQFDRYVFEDCYNDNPVAMDFDRHGGLWVVVLELIGGGCILPAPVISYDYYPDPSDGLPEPRKSLAPGAAFLPGLAIRDRAPVVEVPTLGSWSLWLLVFLLAFGASRALKLR